MDALLGASAFQHVAVDAAAQADLVGGVHVYGEGVEREELCVVQGEDAFDDDDSGGGDGVKGVGDSGVGGEVVDGPLNGLAGGEGAYVGEDELGLERVGVIEVEGGTVFRGQKGEIAVVEIEGEKCGVELGGKLAGESGFAGAGAACDCEDKG